MLVIVTPTGARPEAFELCQRMLERQTYSRPIRWIVVDDGPDQQEIWLNRRNWSVHVIRPRPFWRTGQNTQQRNLKAALEFVDRNNDTLVIWEDDDYYAPDWLQFVADNIHEAELIGEARALYYNVYHRAWDCLYNEFHASLRCSAMRGAAIDTLERVLSLPDRYYDMQLWKRHADRKAFPRKLTIGMKGMPGRGGIALGHDRFGGNADPDLSALKSFVGEDAEWYAPFWKHAPGLRTVFKCARRFLYAGRMYEQDEEFEAKTDSDAEVLFKAGMISRVTALA